MVEREDGDDSWGRSLWRVQKPGYRYDIVDIDLSTVFENLT